MTDSCHLVLYNHMLSITTPAFSMIYQLGFLSFSCQFPCSLPHLSLLTPAPIRAHYRTLPYVLTHASRRENDKTRSWCSALPAISVFSPARVLSRFVNIIRATSLFGCSNFLPSFSLYVFVFSMALSIGTSHTHERCSDTMPLVLRLPYYALSILKSQNVL